MFYPVKNPPKWMLDGLMNERDNRKSTCPDCGVKPGKKHDENCDVARCLNTKGQRLSCNCGECGYDVWTGLWPGIQEAYDRKLVTYDTATSSICFDLNEVARQVMTEAARKKK